MAFLIPVDAGCRHAQLEHLVDNLLGRSDIFVRFYRVRVKLTSGVGFWTTIAISYVLRRSICIVQ